MLLAVLFPGCGVLHDDLSQCDFFLKFRYDYNLAYQDWFGEQVEEVKVFVFDKDGKYVQTFRDEAPALSVPGYRMQIPYHMKGYTMVVWAGRTADDYLLPELTAGDPIDKLTLSYEPLNGNSDCRIAPLWQSGPVTMTFPDEGESTQAVSLIRDTNDFNISISGQADSPKPISDFDICIKGANGSYDRHNNIREKCPEITYIASGYDLGQKAQLYTMRMVQGAPLLLSVAEKSTGRFISLGGKKEIDLTELMLESKPESMSGQEYLDRKYIWDVVLNYDRDTYMAVSVTINGWTYWFHNTDL